MNLDIWTEYSPIQGLLKKYSIESITHSPKKFVIILNSPDNSVKLCVSFNTRVFSYKKTNILYQKSTLETLRKINGNSFTTDWTMFRVEKSNYAKSIAKGSCEIFPVESLLHFVFITPDVFLEIIVGKEPLVAILK